MNAMFAGEVLQQLYDSEINFEIRTDWDGGFNWRFQSDADWSTSGTGKDLAEAAAQLAQAVAQHDPNSQFAAWWNRQAVAA
jgi:hypothetical protein